MTDRMTDQIDELLGRRVDLRALALLRVPVGLLALVHLWPFLDDALAGHIYRDTFTEPYASWYPELSRGAYTALLAAGVAGAALMTVGLLTRLATAVTFGVVAYNLFLSTTHVHNNRAYLTIILAGLAVVPCGRELSLDAWWRARRGGGSGPVVAAAAAVGPAWPLWLLRFEASVVYGASGLSKLLDPDWFGGTVTWHRVVRVHDQVVASPLPGWAVTLLEDRSFHTFAAKAIVLTELFIALGLWSRRTRYAAVWVAVCFHGAIQVTASVEVFSYLAVAALLIWAVPSRRDRVLAVDRSSPGGRRLADAVVGLDWLARFRVVDGTPGSPVTLTDRDGRVVRGRAAVAVALSRLPVTAWFALPVLLAPGVRRARQARAEPLAVPRVAP
jgi:hypothetical protein